MKISNIEELHDKLFEVLCVIDDICQKEGVRYFLDGGTAIGAMRERDFIPWDDDLDIKVLGEDYAAFKKAMEENLPPYMHLIEPASFAPGFYDFIVRIYDERWTIRKETEEDNFYGNQQNHLGTDVFIYFNVPDSPGKQAFLRLKTRILYGMGMAHRHHIELEKYSKLQKCQVAVLATLGKMIPAKTIVRWWERAMNHWQGEATNTLFAGNYPVHQLFCFPSEWYKQSAYGEIRGRQFPVGAGIAKELTAIYGDYMHPPKDKNAFIAHLDPEDSMR